MPSWVECTAYSSKNCISPLFHSCIVATLPPFHTRRSKTDATLIRPQTNNILIILYEFCAALPSAVCAHRVIIPFSRHKTSARRTFKSPSDKRGGCRFFGNFFSRTYSLADQKLSLLCQRRCVGILRLVWIHNCGVTSQFNSDNSAPHHQPLISTHFLHP